MTEDVKVTDLTEIEELPPIQAPGVWWDIWGDVSNQG
jgi:hypothetical protein